MRRTAAILLAAGLLIAVVGCEPKATITATASTNQAACLVAFQIAGTVSPRNATPKVMLQRTVNHVWKDALWQPTVNDPWRPAAGNVTQTTGHYTITYQVNDYVPTMHLRVRSSGSGSTSPAFYVTVNPDSC